MEQPQEKETRQEHAVDNFFHVVVFIKGAQGAFELFASIIVALIPLRTITALADHFTEGELAQDPDDFIATHLHDFAYNVSIGGKEFAALYLFLHGVIKLGLAIGLLSGKRWVYPVALVVMAILILYQAYRIWLHHSPLLMAATLFDCGVFYFIGREYVLVLKHGASGKQR